MSIAGWLPVDWAKAIVPLAVKREQNGYQPIGTAFFVRHNGFLCLFAAKHVILGENGQHRKGLFVPLNMKNGGVGIISIDEMVEKGVTWKSHPQQDLPQPCAPFIQMLISKGF